MSTSVENQKKLWFPTNSDTQTIIYNEHITISNNPLRRTSWEVTKVIDTEPAGLTKITFAQQLEYSSRDDLSWVNTTTNQLSDTEHGIEYDFFQPRTNDAKFHSHTEDENIILFNAKTLNQPIADNSIISFTGVKPNLKCGGSYKTYTANFYKNEMFVDDKPYWKILYYANDNQICELNFLYDGNILIPDNSAGNFIISSDRKITYKLNDEEVFGIQYSYDETKPSNLKLRCLSNLKMVGGKLIITADNGSKTLSASIEVEVDGL